MTEPTPTAISGEMVIPRDSSDLAMAAVSTPAPNLLSAEDMGELRDMALNAETTLLDRMLATIDAVTARADAAEGRVGVLTAALTRAHEEAWGDCDCREAGIKDAVDCWMAAALLTVETEAHSGD